MTVTINGHELGISPQHLDMTVRELAKIADGLDKEGRLIAYLKQKYSGYSGVPFECLADETHMTELESAKYVKYVLGVNGGVKIGSMKAA